MKSTKGKVHPLWEVFQKDLESVGSAREVSELRHNYLSRNRGLISLELKNLAKLSPDRRREMGQRLNQLKQEVGKAILEQETQFRNEQSLAEMTSGGIDVTLPGYRFLDGGMHPVRRVWQQIEEIFVQMGFSVVSGPEVETDYYNFEALNFPKGHPAREDQDTLYISDDLLLRTHTSPVQIRTMEQQTPPIRIIAPGRVYRRDTVDRTHAPMFHQIEGLVVDEGISLADLKGTLEVFFKALFSSETRVILRPSYFPFVEPGVEVDISCIFCVGKGCRVCKNSGWIEILGAGMVHPKVFEMVGYDPERYTGFAWGMGIDRIAQLKYQVNDLRLFFENDIRFLSQF